MKNFLTCFLIFVFLYGTYAAERRPIISLFSGAGGLDLGFEKAGFDVIWANEFDKDIWETFEKNHPKTKLDRRSICDVDVTDIPDCIGIIGGPPCQSWSDGGAKRGLADARGRLFYEYIRVLREKKPLFFLAENVSGMLTKRHETELEEIKQAFVEAGYNLSVTLVNASDYGVPQDRKRVLFIGYRKDLDKTFVMPPPCSTSERKTLRDAIGDLVDVKPSARRSGLVEASKDLKVPNHEYMLGGFSSMYMSRNRVRGWDEPAFTVQASGRQCQLHPQAPKMEKVEDGKFEFKNGSEHLYRRLTVREVARIQTFPDSFVFYYRDIDDGYKMIGNAVPVELARIIAVKIASDLNKVIK
jgi:DNA (cytosine-5)-methyltransferase 1